jgi:hypothetical protein
VVAILLILHTGQITPAFPHRLLDLGSMLHKIAVHSVPPGKRAGALEDGRHSSWAQMMQHRRLR